MSIESISAIAAGIGMDQSPVAAAKTPVSDFGQVLGSGMVRADEAIKASDQQLRTMAAGKDIPVQDVMITMEQARMDMMLMVEVRNRVVEAYQELLRMQL